MVARASPLIALPLKKKKKEEADDEVIRFRVRVRVRRHGGGGVFTTENFSIDRISVEEEERRSR
jgi:hypothetical protein